VSSNDTVRRRNKWLCALKTNLAELKVYGPSGNPNVPPSVDRYTEVPWEVIERKDREADEQEMLKLLEEEERRKAGHSWKLGDKNAVLSMFYRDSICRSFVLIDISRIVDSADAVFGETAEVSLTAFLFSPDFEF